MLTEATTPALSLSRLFAMPRHCRCHTHTTTPLRHVIAAGHYIDLRLIHTLAAADMILAATYATREGAVWAYGH